MKVVYYYNKVLMGMVLMAAFLLVACSNDDDAVTPAPVLQLVNAQMNFSLPKRITGRKHAPTRMTSDVVQESETEGKEAEFRGIDDVHLLCFDSYPSATSNKMGSIIEVKTKGDDVVDTMTTDDYSLCQEIGIPVGTSHFAFYARAADAPKTHADRMKYGTVETVGLDRQTYQDNSSIRFRPVPICDSTEPLGGSVVGQRLLALLNNIINVTGPEAYPNNKLSTVNNLWLNEAYQRLTSLTVLSSYHVQTVLGVVNKLVNQEPPDDQGRQLAAVIAAMIAGCCTEVPAPDSDHITLKDSLMGFPTDIHLPVGAARIEWNADEGRLQPASVHAYGKSLNVLSINDYVYPINLQYQVFSDLLASDEQVLFSEEEKPAGEEGQQYSTWQELLDEGYVDADKAVKTSTQSVAMVQQVQYAVGRLALRARIGTDDSVKDANGNVVAMSDGIFTLNGYIVGGQREVDYNFQPVMTSRKYAIYDTVLNGGPQDLKRHYFSGTDYILGLGTVSNENICVAMELVNNGPAFQGADGVIAPGATFYLVADMNPLAGMNYSAGNLDQIFSKDRATKVNLTIKSLATATCGMPSLDMPHPTVAVSVDLHWGEGLWFEEEL